MPHPPIDFASLRDRTLPLGDGREQAIHASVLDRQARHVTRLRRARIAAALATVLSVVVLMVHRRPTVPAATPLAGSPASPPATSSAVATADADFGGIVLADGSRATFLVAGTELAQSGAKGRQTTLVRGAARFDVLHDADAPFRVTAGSVVIEDIGTVFTVRLEDGGRTRVSVASGSVSVRGADAERVLMAGDLEVFPVPSPSTRPSASTPSIAPHPASWKTVAQSGDYDRAYTMIQAPGATVRDDPEELLLAADSARLSGHPDRAVSPLQRMISRFPQDSRAGLAAFTLGRVLLDDLGRSRDAAAAFATAYDRGGPLAEDALAREVEAWARAGDRATAKSVAARYLTAYPTGRQVAFVHRLSEDP